MPQKKPANLVRYAGPCRIGHPAEPETFSGIVGLKITVMVWKGMNRDWWDVVD
jgi:hypothetical protein